MKSVFLIRSMTANYKMAFDIKYLFWVLLCLLLLTPRGNAQIIGLDLLGEDDEVGVPFSYEQGFIIVKFWLNGIIPLRMILDTGAQNTILFDKEIAQILGIKYERDIKIMGSDLDAVLQAKIARRVSTRLAGCKPVLRDIIVLEENTLLLSEKLGTEINGIIGGSFFSNLVMDIDYGKQKIYFTHPQKFKAPNDKGKKWWQFWRKPRQYQKFPISITQHKPYLKAEVQVTRESRRELDLLLDTGASLPFLVHANTDTTIQLPSRVMIGKVGYGLSGEILGYRGKAHLMKIGEDIAFSDILTSFQDLEFAEGADENLIRNGIIGNILLERFDVIIDYTRQNLYLRPNKNYDEEFSFDKSGITTLAVGPRLDQFYIIAVSDKSPAARAGIQVGDVITRINNRNAKKITLPWINTILAGKSGKKVKLTLKRGDKQLKREIILKEWF